MSGRFPDQIPEDILAIRGLGVTFYALRDGPRVYLIDTGFVGGPWFLRRALSRRGWGALPIAGILLTHGHLDHALNTAHFAETSGAWVAAHHLERDQIAGHYRHHGAGIVCGLLEAAGRPVLRYKPRMPDRWLDDGEELPIWSGLRVVHLPGHTDGHIGFHDPRRRILFSGDLFASYPLLSHRPPNVLNSDPSKIPASVERALSLDPAGLLPNHGTRSTPARHLERLRKLAASPARQR